MFIITSLPFFANALTTLECYRQPGCRGGRSYSTNPSTGSSVRINPSAVPTDRGLGLEGIFFKDNSDFSIVRGLGRVGAAISPSNSEETFFGPPGFEVPEDFLRRKQDQTKYPGQKVTLATAFDVAKRSGTTLESYALKVGVMGRYNQLTKNVSPGAGLSGLFGPLTFGGSVYQDESQLDYRTYGLTTQPVARYRVETYTAGLYLNSLIIDYSYLRMISLETSIVRTLTASLTLKKVILTASKRTEDSPRPYYNYQTQKLEYLKTKDEYFGGLQINAGKHLMIGALYNYYLLREVSGTVTLFF